MNSDLVVRKANDTELDCRLVYDLSNDQLVRNNSFNTAEIIWDNHVSWYRRMVSNPNVLFYLVFSSEQFVGQVRFSRTSELSNECTISISVASDFRGKHLGNKLMADCIKKMSTDWTNIQHILAEVKDDNVASNMLFQKGNFTLEMTVNRYRYKVD